MTRETFEPGIICQNPIDGLPDAMDFWRVLASCMVAIVEISRFEGIREIGIIGLMNDVVIEDWLLIDILLV